MIEEGNERNIMSGCGFAFEDKGKCNRELIFKAIGYSL